MTYCTNCGAKLMEHVKFCTNCGEKTIIEVERNDSNLLDIEDNLVMPHVPHDAIKKVNKKIELKNNQTPIAKKFWYAGGFFLLIIIVAFLEIVEVHPAIVMLSIFFCIMSVIIGFMLRSRGEKLQKLISGEGLIASWTLTSEQKKNYVNYLFKQEAGKNIVILFSIATIATIVFGIFILVIDEGKFFMFLVLIGLIVFLSLSAFGMPYYYKMKNSKGDGNILLGAKYAYINGYFHNWDFPHSGLSKIKMINEPFYGIYMMYFYTDRTLEHSEELFIPAPQDIDSKKLVATLKKSNAKHK